MSKHNDSLDWMKRRELFINWISNWTDIICKSNSIFLYSFGSRQLMSPFYSIKAKSRRIATTQLNNRDSSKRFHNYHTIYLSINCLINLSNELVMHKMKDIVLSEYESFINQNEFWDKSWINIPVIFNLFSLLSGFSFNQNIKNDKSKFVYIQTVLLSIHFSQLKTVYSNLF